MNTRNLILASIFTIIEYFTHSGAFWGQTGHKKGQTCLPTNGQKSTKLVKYDIQHEKFDSCIHFQLTRILKPF